MRRRLDTKIKERIVSVINFSAAGAILWKYDHSGI